MKMQVAPTATVLKYDTEVKLVYLLGFRYPQFRLLRYMLFPSNFMSLPFYFIRWSVLRWFL